MQAFVKAGLAAALLCTLAAPRARAQLASRPVGEEPSGPRERRGLYAGLLADVGAQFVTGVSGATAKVGYGGEARLGFAFNRQLQLYVAGALTNASSDGSNQQFIMATVHLHHMAWLDRSGVGVYYDVGLGLGFANPSTGGSGSTDVGFGYAGAIGVEIPLGRYLSLTPEFVYRGMTTSANLPDGGSASYSLNFVGLQVGVLYY